MTTGPGASSAPAHSDAKGPTKLDPASGHITLINTYSVDPARADELVAFLVRSTYSTIRHVPGFVSANLHVSLDGTRVVNYAQWANMNALAAARADPGVAALMEEQLRIAQSFSPVPYELRASIPAAGET